MSIQDERMRRMREAGIPMPITQLQGEGVNSIQVTSQNADRFARLQALKSGANKQTVQTLIKSKTVQNSFEGIPEPTKRRVPQGHPGNKVDPSKLVAVENFAGEAPISAEFAAMEAMLGGGSSAPINMNMYQTSNSEINTTQPELKIQEDGYGPSFDPIGMLAKKRNEMQQKNPYLKHAITPQQQVPQVPQMAAEQQAFDIKYMQKMMQEIARNTISEVLNSYTEKNKEKLTYEHVNVKTADGTKVIKTQDGKYFKLIPVKLKN